MSTSSSTDHLTDSQREALAQFTAITSQTESAAIPILTRSQWNVELAITRFFDGETSAITAEALQAEEYALAAGAPPAAAPAARPPGPTASIPASASGFGLPRRPTISPAPRIVPQPNSLARRPPLLISILLFPFSLLYRLTSGTWSLLHLLFPFLPRFRPVPKRSHDPRDTAARFIRTFEEEAGTEAVKLPWHEGSYASALDLSKSSLRFLLVVLQSDEHDDTAAFNKNILLSGEVSGFLQQNDIILWGGSVQESEAYQVSTALGCTKFPFAALITHAPNTPPGTSSQGMSVVARMAGVTTAQGFVQKMQTAVERYRPALERIRGERAARDFDRRMREEQENAYEQSLALDRQRAQERRAAEEAERRKAEEAEKARIEKEIKEAKRQQWRKWRAGRILEEPNEGARVSIRTAEGERIVRKFPKEARLEEVYAFVECLGVETQGTEETEEPRDYTHEYAFRLCSMMPRKVYEPEVGTVGEVLWPSGNLVVESLGDEDEEEDEEDDEE